MGLNADNLKVLKPYLKAKTVLCLSYPDLVMSGEDVEQILGVKAEVFTDNGAWHGKKHQLPETRDVFAKLGIETARFVDVHASRGCEDIVDLNEPSDLGKFDLVIDAGTTEHCFNIGQAIKNAASAVRYGGVIFHSVPMCMMNHGFWNFSPTALLDFYQQNGWKVEVMLGFGTGREPTQLPPVKRFQIGGEWSITLIARRLSESALQWPMQTKYKLNPELKIA